MHMLGARFFKQCIDLILTVICWKKGEWTWLCGAFTIMLPRGYIYTDIDLRLPSYCGGDEQWYSPQIGYLLNMALLVPGLYMY